MSTALNEEIVKMLLHYTILAPSSHNTQPWKFGWAENQIQVYADFTRWLPVADADRREIYISVGCALENLLLAAQAFRYNCRVTYFPNPDHPDRVANVDLQETPSLHDEQSLDLFSAVLSRRTYHHGYRQQKIEEKIQAGLRSWIYSTGVSLQLIDQPEPKYRIEELIVQGDILQFSDPDFREELGYWIGQSAFGTPWLISKMGQWVVTHFDRGQQQSGKDSTLLSEAPLVGILYTQHNRREDQVKVGQAYERINLGCAKRGIGVQPMSQPLQVPELKEKLRQLLPDPTGYPQHLFRLGYAKQEQKPTPRRPLEEFLILNDSLPND